MLVSKPFGNLKFPKVLYIYCFPYNAIKMVKKQKIKCNEKLWDDIDDHMKDPEYIKAAYEFIRLTS